MSHLTSPRLLFYAVNGLGLGHVTRLLAIARAVRRRRPQAQILFLTTSEADQVIYAEGFAAVKLPSRTAVEQTGLRPSTFLKLTHSVVLNTVSAFNPAVLIADTFPAGASQELLATLSWEMRRAFVFRAQQQDRARDPFFQAAVARYDLCLIPHTEGSEAIPLPDTLAAVWTGEIFLREKDDLWSRAQARAYLGLPREGKVLYVTFGGGGETEMNQALEAVGQAVVGTDWTVAVPDAPLQKTALAPLNGVPMVRIRHYPMSECFSAFDAAVSAAGYNTVNELMHFGIPSVLIPFPRGLDDQGARVSKLAHQGAALAGTLAGGELRRRIEQLADPACAAQLRERAAAQAPGSGAGRAADALLTLLG